MRTNSFRGGQFQGEYKVVTAGDLANRQALHPEKEYSITLEANKEDVLPGDVLYEGGITAWEVLSTRVDRRKGTLLCQVKTTKPPV
jgi:hypothetical protein